jgi:hypothetical protein
MNEINGRNLRLKEPLHIKKITKCAKTVNQVCQWQNQPFF